MSHKRQFAVGLTRVYTHEADSAHPLLKCNLWGHLYYTDSQVQGSEGPTKMKNLLLLSALGVENNDPPRTSQRKGNMDRPVHEYMNFILSHGERNCCVDIWDSDKMCQYSRSGTTITKDEQTQTLTHGFCTEYSKILFSWCSNPESQ